MPKQDDINSNGINRTPFISKSNDRYPAVSFEDVRSEEVLEIIGKMPHWIVRRGIATIAILFITILVGTYFFRYPESVPAKVIISSGNTPLNIIAPHNLSIQTLLVDNKQEVIKGQVLGAYSNAAPYEEVARITAIINAIDTSFNLKNTIRHTEVPPYLQLGALQLQYVALYRSIAAYKTVVLETATNKASLSQQRAEHDLLLEIKEAVSQFKNHYAKWEQSYIIKSPVDGTVSLANFSWKRNHPVAEGQNILQIIPHPHDITLTGKVSLDHYRKIKTGQTVLLNPKSYPAEEFGMLEAKIIKHSCMANDTIASITLKLNQGLTTSQGKTIPADVTLLADAEIITDNKTVLSRLFESIIKPLKH